MSHFSVLVIGPDPEKQLAPYHEYECTGEADQYVVPVDITQEAREEYAKATNRFYVDVEGNRHSPYGYEFYREPTAEELPKIGLGTGFGGNLMWASRDWEDGKGYRAKVHYLPEGFTEVTLPATETKTFAEFIESHHEYEKVEPGAAVDTKEKHRWGWYKVDETGEVTEVLRFTNPNKKWDWYVTGGRYGKRLRLYPGVEAMDTPVPRPSRFVTRLFRAEAAGKEWNPSLSVAAKHVDQALRGNIDFEGMRKAAEEKGGEEYDKTMAIVGPHMEGFQTWDVVFAKHPGNVEAARAEYHAQPARVAVKDHRDFWFTSLDEFACTREEYVKRCGEQALMTFAVVKDGKWYERGEMGWWAAVFNEKDHEAWSEEYAKLVENLPDDTLLTMIDCHI